MKKITAKQLNEIKEWVRTQVSAKRYEHIQGVVRSATLLAARYGASVEKAQAAAWLHDCAKERSRSEMLSWIRKSPFKLDPDERAIPALWHPHAGAGMALNLWKIEDKDVLQAIRCHTLGTPEMSLLAQIVFVADFIERGRTFEGVQKMRLVAKRDLRSAVLLKCSMTIEYLFSKNMRVHARLLQTWNAFLAASGAK